MQNINFCSHSIIPNFTYLCYNYGMETIYLDHAAATPLNQKAFVAMRPYFAEEFYNPSAPYLPAKHVREAYEQAKADLAHCVGAKGVDLVVTAGATESINLAFTARHGRALILATEHAAVIEAVKHVGGADYTLIKVKRSGLIDLDDLREKLTDEVDFVSISLANNELGTIQPLAEIAEILRLARQNRLARGVKTPIFFHSDASQALNLIDINVARLGVDLLTINAAKCGGPKGVGALYVAHGVRLTPVTYGGGQEKGLRSGTENVPGLIGFAVAAQEAKAHLNGNRKKYAEMARVLRQTLSQNTAKTSLGQSKTSPHTSIVVQQHENVNTNYAKKSELSQVDNSSDFPQFLGDNRHQLANFVPVCFPGIDAERLIYRLEARGVLVSTGAACAASKGSKSHVLTAIGLTDEEIAGSIRISLGSTNDLAQVKRAAEIICEEVAHEYARSGHDSIAASHDKEQYYA